MATTAYAVKQALYDKLRARPALSELVDDQAIWYGFEGHAGSLPRKCIQIGEIVWDYDKPASMGNASNLSRTESYSIMILLESHVPGDTQVQANANLKALVDEIEALLKDARSLEIANIITQGFEPEYSAEGQDGTESRGAIMLGRVHITARK